MKGTTDWFRDRKLPPPTYGGNIPKLFLFYALYNAMFFTPTWVIFLQEVRGLTLFQVTLIDISFWGTSLLFSLPVGILADSFGRKRSMMLAMVFVVAAVILFTTATTFPLLMLANICFSLSFALEFGATLSLFYDSLKQVGREAEFTKQRGMLSAVMFGSAAISGAIGGLLGEIDLRLPFIAYAVVNLFTVYILSTLKETPYEPDPETGARISYRRAFKTAFQTIKQNTNLRYIFLYSNFIFLSTVIMGQVFIMPYALSIGIPIAALGIIAFGMQGVRMLGSSSADRLVKFFGEWRWMTLAPILVVIGAFGMGLIHSWVGILVFALVGFGATATRPLIETLIIRNAPGSVRSTMLSIDMMIFNLFIVILEPGLGYLADNQGIPAAFLAMAIFGVISLGLTLLFWRGVWKRAESKAHS